MSLSKLPEVVETEIIDKEFFELRKEKLKIDEGKYYDYFTLVGAPIAVMVIAQTKDGDLVLNWEYRHPVRKILLSCPGGIKDEGENNLDCAKRELLEETGYHADRFEEMGEAYPFPGVCNQKTVFVFAEDAVLKQKPKLEIAEYIETVLISPKKLKELIGQNVAVDGLLLTALFFFKEKLF